MTSRDPELPAVPNYAATLLDAKVVDDLAGAAPKPNTAEMDSKTVVGIPTEGGTSGVQVSVGDVVGKYEIRSQLGSGGMGAVYLAFDPMIEREVALKILSPDIGNSPVAVQRFLGEARAIGRLNHAHVVSVYDIGQWKGQYYLVMELLSGGSAAERVAREKRLPWEDACRIVCQAARGLSAAHAAGMIHRDIKPENLMLTKDGDAKVVDFGLSKLLDSSIDPEKAVTRAGQILGTPQYMSPEQFEAAEVDARTDIYSLGGTLFQLLTGQFPFNECRSVVQIMTSHLTKAPPRPTQVDSTIPQECDRIVARAMAKSPSDRYETAAEMAADVEKLLKTPSPVSAQGRVDAPETDHPLSRVVVVEPSKLQGTILRDAIMLAGASSVQLLGNIQSAQQAVALEQPDLLITAMQLSDGQGIDLLRGLCQEKRLSNTTLVLNSSDSTIEQLISVGEAPCLILAPKKVRGDDILRVVHAAGSCVVQNGPLAEPVNPAGIYLRIVLDGGRIPDVLAELIRELRLLNVEVETSSVATGSGSSPANLTLLLQREPALAEDPVAVAAMLRSLESGSMTAAIHLDRGKLFLRMVIRNNVVAVCRCLVDSPRLVRLLQGYRSR